MPALAICHQRDAGPGVFAEAAAAAGHRLDEWYISETRDPPADPFGYDAVISFGGAMHADQADLHPWIADEVQLLAELVERGRPVLGVCLGSQLLTLAAGGRVRPASEPEIGWHRVELTAEGAADPLLGPLAPGLEAFGWHSYECLPPAGAAILARSEICVQAFRLGGRSWGIQFHAEVSAGDAAGWITDYEADPDAVRIGLDPRVLGAQTAPRIGAWNELGRALCRRFLAAAVDERYSPVSGVR